MNKKILFFFLFLKTIVSFAQSKPVSVGNWRVHLPYDNVINIAETKGKIFAAGQFGAFAFIKADGSIERLTPLDGYSDYEISFMKYDWVQDYLIIAYRNSKIDIIKGNRIAKNNDIFNKTIVGTKKINHINIVGNIAYLSTSFGLLELDFVKNEIRNSYQNIGPNGAQIEVFSSAILNDSIYISGKNGIFKAKNSPIINLADFNNWFVSKTALIGSNFIAEHQQKLYSEIDSQLFVYENRKWQLLEPYSKAIVTNIDVNHSHLIIGVYGKHIINIDNNNVKTYEPINILNQAMKDDKGFYWYASPTNGLVYKEPTGEINFFPNGPRAETSYKMLNAYNDFLVMGGSYRETNYAPNFKFIGYYQFDNFNWKNKDMSQGLMNGMYDLTVASFQKSSNKLFVGSHGAGLLQFNNNIPQIVYNDSNSPLRKRGGFFNIISGLNSDKNNNLWVSNYDVDSSLHQLTNRGIWISYKLPVATNSKIEFDSRNNKWLLALGNGIIVLNDKNTANKIDDIVLRVTETKGQGNLPTNNVNDIAFTKGGELLIGTDLGYVRIRNPNNIFTGGNFEAERTVVSVEAGSSLGGNILESEIINCITIDGGDRRWFGTDKGAWLYDNDGSTLIYHFTRENSPLPSNNILSIGINENTGEVFFGTDKGLISFRSDAMPAAKNFENLKIFPNPVRPDFDGNISIEGLMDNSIVKITDINGNLVHQTFSNGGLATWNCRTFSGERPSTGVYLVFCMSADGEQTEAGKILFIK